MLSPVDNLDEAVQKLGGKVTLTVDRTNENAFSIKIQNASATKTYKQPYKLPNLNADASNTNIRCFLVPEGSYINFLQSNIVPIGGLTSAEDKNPLSMVLQNVPDQVNAGTSLEEAVAGITADEVTATVEVKVAESVVATVSNSAGIIGAENNSTGWWTVFSDNFNVPAGETRSISFTNYTSQANNWSNFAIVLRKADLAEYAVVRADNYGWGAGYDGNASLVHNGTQGDWATWLADMNGAKVTVYVTNCGNGTADIQAVMKGTSGTSYAQYYLGINKLDMNDLNFALTIEGGHLVF